MNVIQFNITLEALSEHEIRCSIGNAETEPFTLLYYPIRGEMLSCKNNPLFQTIDKNIFQFGKIIRSAIQGNASQDRKISAVIIEDFPFIQEGDYNRFIRMDTRSSKFEISISETPLNNIYRIFADGSFSGKTSQSGLGGFIESPDGKQEMFNKAFVRESSNLMELLAVSEGLELLKEADTIQINTDSRFVIRGLIQWIHFWKINHWQTAQGTPVKYSQQWQHLYKMCQGKLIEFNWIKSHSGNKEQDFCHWLARESALEKNESLKPDLDF